MTKLTQEERDQRIAEIARGVVLVPKLPTTPCPRCGGPWLRDYVPSNEPSRYAFMWICLYCGEVSYGG